MPNRNSSSVVTKSLNITEKMVLGTAQFGMDYGIANLTGKPTKRDVFDMLELAWEKGVRRFDTAPDYGSEAMLGEFITANGLRDEAKVLTKIPSLEDSSDYQQSIRTSLESSLNYLGCSIDVLFFHNAADSSLLLKEPQFFEKMLQDYSVSTIGVSVYEPQEVERLSDCESPLAFQFPFNVLDRRFERVRMPQGKRYARSVFLQGLLASQNGLRPDAPLELLNLKEEFHSKLAEHHLDAVGYTTSFVARNNAVDYLLIGVDSAKQLQDLLDLEIFEQQDMDILDTLNVDRYEQWLDPREWN